MPGMAIFKRSIGKEVFCMANTFSSYLTATGGSKKLYHSARQVLIITLSPVRLSILLFSFKQMNKLAFSKGRAIFSINRLVVIFLPINQPMRMNSPFGFTFNWSDWLERSYLEE
jgi:hypothetical protein